MAPCCVLFGIGCKGNKNQVKTRRKMKKYIRITKEDREFLAKAFGVTERTVTNAVRFDAERGGTELARKIRKVALERGGVPMVVMPEAELEEVKG